MNKTNVTYMDVNALIPYANNPRLNDNAVDAVAASIKEFGFKVPIVIDGENVIINGHTRLKAARKLGLTQVPAIVADDLTPEQVKAFRLADNKTGEIAQWDIEKLEIELDGIDDIDMGEFGFDDMQIDSLDEETEIVEDEVPELQEEPKAKLGDIYQLGNHRLMCGDSTIGEDVNKLMNGVKADLVFTDPPYGMKKENDGVANDNLNYDDLLEFNKKWIPITFNNLKDNGSWYCWGIDEPLMDIYSNILKPMKKQNKITFRNFITWDKGNGQGQLSSEYRMYPIADEKCLFVMCGVQGFNTNQDNYFEEFEPVRSYLEKEIKKIGESDKKIANALGYKDGRTVNHWWSKSQWTFPTEENVKALQEYAKTKGISIFENINGIKAEYEKIKAEYYSTRAYFDNTHDNMNNVWNFSRTSGDEKESAAGHATPKPIALCSRAIETSSRENENVLDVFGGSGSTLIACEQLNRNCFMMELEPRWVDVIIQRWENFTGQKAKLLNEV